MLRKAIWNIFINTGNIEAYLYESRCCQLSIKTEKELIKASSDK